MTHIVSSRNFFLDTASGLKASSTGDNVTIALAGDTITCADGQQIRLSLREFSMYRNWYGVNPNNSDFRVTTEVNSDELSIGHADYKCSGDIVKAFANVLGNSLLSMAITKSSLPLTTTFSVVDQVPAEGQVLTATGTRDMQFQIQFLNSTGQAVTHGLTTVLLQSFAEVGELYSLLGGNRVNEITDTTSKSFDVTIQTSSIIVSGYYPCQRTSESHLYVRCGLNNSNMQTSSHASVSGVSPIQTMQSNILAAIPLDTEFVHFRNSTENEFFINATSPSISSLRLFLTDSKNRPLGRIAGSRAGSAVTSLSNVQSTLGNLNFKATLRIDIVQVSIPRSLQTKPLVHEIPARLSNAVISSLPV